MKKVYVALFIYKGVLSGVEVYGNRAMAEAQRDEWKKQASENDDVVDVLDKEVIRRPAPARQPRRAGSRPATPLIKGGTPLARLPLSNMLVKRLRRSRIYTVEELCQVDERELLSYRLIGAKSLDIIKQALDAKGLSLAL